MNITVYLTKETATALEKIIQARKCTRSQAVQRAIADYFIHYFLNKGEDSCGSVIAPTPVDTKTN